MDAAVDTGAFIIPLNHSIAWLNNTHSLLQEVLWAFPIP